MKLTNLIFTILMLIIAIVAVIFGIIENKSHAFITASFAIAIAAMCATDRSDGGVSVIDIIFGRNEK